MAKPPRDDPQHRTIRIVQMHIEIIAVGKLKRSPLEEIWKDYIKRMHWRISLHEIEHASAAKTEDKICALMSGQKAYKIALDERGKTMSSPDFAKSIEKLQNNNHNHLQFIIGESKGLSERIRNECDLLLSFGKQTWPHMMVRIMLIEQIYRTQQILAGHPYHK